jgi:glycosyltransferase involved in cell wall biosynthesis
MRCLRWAIITGEYPPQSGGVSDYTRQVAHGLGAVGDEVHVWAPACAQPTPLDPGVKVHRLPGRFGPHSLASLSDALDRLPRPYRLLVQYVPHNFGWKGMNVPFCLWLASRRREPVWVMFHEVVFPLSTRQPMTHNLLGIVTRLMASLVARKAERIFVSIPAWESLLPKHSNVQRHVTWLPVPSNLPTGVPPTAAAELRRQLAREASQVIIGHFGTFGAHITPLLTAILPPLLQRDSRRLGLLIGRGSERFAGELGQRYPMLSDRLRATGDLASVEVATHLMACDCLVQPFPDGVSTRRTSLMAGLALGVPIVTTDGPLTEKFWRESEAVALVPSYVPLAAVEAVETLLADPGRRTELGRRAAAVYKSRFSLAHTIRRLRSSGAENRRSGEWSIEPMPLGVTAYSEVGSS